MTNVMASAIRGAIIVTLLLASGSAFAERRLERDDQPGLGQGRVHERGEARGHAYGRQTSAHSVPEFAPAAAGALAVLVAGGGVLVARRRRR